MSVEYRNDTILSDDEQYHSESSSDNDIYSHEQKRGRSRSPGTDHHHRKFRSPKKGSPDRSPARSDRHYRAQPAVLPPPARGGRGRAPFVRRHYGRNPPDPHHRHTNRTVSGPPRHHHALPPPRDYVEWDNPNNVSLREVLDRPYNDRLVALDMFPDLEVCLAIIQNELPKCKNILDVQSLVLKTIEGGFTGACVYIIELTRFWMDLPIRDRVMRRACMGHARGMDYLLRTGFVTHTPHGAEHYLFSAVRFNNLEAVEAILAHWGHRLNLRSLRGEVSPQQPIMSIMDASNFKKIAELEESSSAYYELNRLGQFRRAAVLIDDLLVRFDRNPRDVHSVLRDVYGI